MIVFVDNGTLYGWYYKTEGCYYGDGTRGLAEEYEREFEENY